MYSISPRLSRAVPRTSAYMLECTVLNLVLLYRTCDPDDTHDGHACPDTYLSI